ncbi:amino acid permease-domain-containing protein [Suillus spraguei]|nr:amino acid permease-domain-containing protein [Suillus spraguei]
MVWGWAVAGPFIMCIGLAMAELASAAPTSGGVCTWRRHCFILAHHESLAILLDLFTCFSTVPEFSVMDTSVNWACAIQIAAAISIASNQTYVTTNEQLYGIYTALILSHAVLVSLRLYTFVNLCLCFTIIIALPIATHSKTEILYVHMSEEASNAATAIPWAIVRINISLAFCMGTDLGSVLNSPIGQPMAQILYTSLGQKGGLALWCLIISTLYVLAAHGTLRALSQSRYIVTSNSLLVGSRQTFAFARDGALPFSRYLYRINGYTKTPVNTVWFDTACVLVIGLLAFVSTAAINAVFTIGLTASYVSYITPITTRFAFKNDFKPGPFHLGKLSLPVAVIAVSSMIFMIIVFFFPSTPQTTVQEMNYTVVVLGGYMALAIFWYYCPVYGGVHWFKGPVTNLTPSITDACRDGNFVSEKEQRDAELSVSVVDV